MADKTEEVVVGEKELKEEVESFLENTSFFTKTEKTDNINRGDLSEELKTFLAFASEKVIKHQAFQLFDADGDGTITVDELKTLINKVGGNMTEAEASALIKMADKDGNSGVDYTEFAKLWAAIRGGGEEEKEIRAEFLKLDTDNSGNITKEEMLAVLVNCEHFGGDKMEEAKKCIDELDVDKDGCVSYPEFLLVWRYKK